MVEKFTYESEPGVELPALLFRPDRPGRSDSVIVHVSDRGKPARLGERALPAWLASRGYTVLSLDARGIGETGLHTPGSTTVPAFMRSQFPRELLAIQAPTFKRTMFGMRTLDVVRAVDYLESRGDLKMSRIVLVGEGAGGLWVLAAASFDARVASVVCVGTLSSYKLLMRDRYDVGSDYFWVPGALRDYDIPDLVRLVAPRPQLWIDSVDEVSARMSLEDVSSIVGAHDALHIVKTEGGTDDEVGQAIENYIE